MARSGKLPLFYQVQDDNDEFKSLRVTHDYTLEFSQYYRDLLRDNEAEPGNSPSDTNIDDVYQTLSARIYELDDNEVNKLIRYLNQSVKLIVTTSSSESKAFQLFEVLNDRGRSLEPMDLVENNFLKILNQDGFNQSQIKEYNEDWNLFLKNLFLTPKTKIKSSIFMKHFIMSEYGLNLKQEKLFDFFNGKIDKITSFNGSDIISLTKKLKENSEVYASIEKNQLDNLFIKDNDDLYNLFKIVRVKQMHPILMKFYDADDFLKCKVIDLCLRYAAGTIFASIQTNTLEKDIPNIIKKMNETHSYEKMYTILDQEIQAILKSRMDKLKANIELTNFVNAKGKPSNKALYILKFLELYFYKNPLIIKTKTKRKISLEHILGRTLNETDLLSNGFVDYEDFQNHLNKLGNLTILYTDENSSASNKNFLEKANIYEHSDFLLTRSLIKDEKTGIKSGQYNKYLDRINSFSPIYKTEKWSKSMIQQRGKDLANLFESILLEPFDTFF